MTEAPEGDRKGTSASAAANARREEALADLVREGLGKVGRATFRTRGGSMRPFVVHGTTVHVENVDPSAVRPGDVVVFTRGMELVAHRVLRQRRREGRRIFITKGDVLNAPDEPVAEESLVGRVVAIERNGRLLRLDTPVLRLLGRTVAWTSPASRWPVGFLRFLRRGLRGRGRGPHARRAP